MNVRSPFFMQITYLALNKFSHPKNSQGVFIVLLKTLQPFSQKQ